MDVAVKLPRVAPKAPSYLHVPNCSLMRRHCSKSM